MPNVEIHGLDKGAARGARKQIFDMFAGGSYVDEMVVTIYPTEVTNAKGTSQPFLRLANSCQAHTGEIIKRLKALGMDIERLELAEFIPKTG